MKKLLSFITLLNCLLIPQVLYALSPNLIVGIYDNYPLTFINKEGKPSGILVSVFNDIAEKEAWKLQYKKLPLNFQKKDIDDNNINIILSPVSKEKSSKNFILNKEPIFINWARIYNNRNFKLETFEDLENQKIAVLKKDVFHTRLLCKARSHGIKIQTIEASSYDEVFTLVGNGTAQAGVVSRIFGANNFKKYEIDESSIIFCPVELRFAFSKKLDKKFIYASDLHILAMKNDYNSILYNKMRKFNIHDITPENSMMKTYIIIAMLFLFSFLSFIFFFKYKKNIDSRIAELDAANKELSSKIKQKKLVEKTLQSERKKLKEFSDNVKEVIWILDVKEKKVLFVSKAYQDIWQRDPEDLYNNSKEWIESVFHEDKIKVYRLYKKLLEEKHDVEREYRIVRPDGEIRWIHDRSYIVKDEPEEIVKIVGIAEDITQKKFFEIQLRQSQKMQAIGTMAGGIAHDFNNILGIILGNTELAMLSTEKQSEIDKNLKQIESASIRAKEIIQQILTFTRKSKMEKEVIDAGEITLETLNLLRAIIPSNVKINTEIEKKKFYVMAAPSQLNQIIMNLCTNASFALKNTGKGILEIIIEPLTIDSNNNIFYELEKGEYLRIWIKDNGPGIEKDIINRIFDPYFTTKAVGQGSGMGLSVVHGIVKDLNGKIMVSSSPRKGTEFQVIIPLTKIVNQEISQTEPQEIMGSERILFVDDEENLIILGKGILKPAGFKVEAFTDPIEALKKFKDSPNDFHIVVTDMTMPKMSGLELAEEIKGVKSDIPIILCTGYSDFDIERKLKENQITRHLLKPVKSMDLKKAVREELDKQKNLI